eukprot:TRINITY_DN7109_c0_g1_i1.p1 TRINITY_DN7109_c0_g1~~TRINITY_DN7109_c0_g1_i1.p1  ORF type:complete len:514 (+),score=160.26 TRINITY_DN7109_c0_g1_i1:47-1543(+)
MTDFDVIVIGAGISGLSAAKQCQEAGLKVAVLEARDRVGGRTLTIDVDGHAVDLGGMWTNPNTQQNISRVCKELNVESFFQFENGKKILEVEGNVSSYSSSIPSLSLFNLIDLQLIIFRFEWFLRKINVFSPFLSNRAYEFDSTSVEAFLKRVSWSSATISMIDVASRIILGQETRDVSLLWWLYYFKSGKGVDSLIEVKGAQLMRFKGGAQQVSKKLAEKIGEKNVIFNSPVVSIDYNDSGVSILTREGKRYTSKYVIVAIPPALCGRIFYSPPLPPLKDQLFQKWSMGYALKVICIYPKPFWREKGFSGEAISDGGPVTIVFDTSTPNLEMASLTSFLVGDVGRRWGAEKEGERKKEILKQLKRYFGDEAEHPTYYHEMNWGSEPYSGGCPVCSLPTGGFSSFGDQIRKPVGNIHWAATETATEWAGFMDGAVTSGERAAQEVIQRISGKPLEETEVRTDRSNRQLIPRPKSSSGWLLLCILVLLIGLYLGRGKLF